MDHLKKLSLSKLQKGDFDKFKFLVNKLLESHGFMKEKYIKTQQSIFYEQERLKGYYGSDPSS